MKRHLDVEEILTELQALAEDSTGPATVAILACMDVVERHGRIADEAELKARVPEAGPLIVQHLAQQPSPYRPDDGDLVTTLPDGMRNGAWIVVDGRWEIDEQAPEVDQ